jgi:hypothetical protein
MLTPFCFYQYTCILENELVITPPTLGVQAFNENASSRKIYVPTESVDVYKTADEWSSYGYEIKGYDF